MSNQNQGILASDITRTASCARGWGVCGVAAAGGEAIFDVLDALGFVGIREPVLAHEEVVGEADGAASHENLRDGEGRHCRVCQYGNLDAVVEREELSRMVYSWPL
jgi:hypothetical protein